MNCKPGDMAVFIKSTAGNVGRFVTCIRLLSATELAEEFASSDEPVWLIDTEVNLTTIFGGIEKAPFAHDRNLQPIRPPATPVTTTEPAELTA